MKRYDFNPENYKIELIKIVESFLNSPELSSKNIDKILKLNPKDRNQIFSREQLIKGINWLKQNHIIPNLNENLFDVLIDNIKMKPMRTISGVTTVTVLTKPFACPGQCIFCPNDVRMPKSYITNEPGAQRALMNRFSPYAQVYNRLQAIKSIGHPVDKIELLVLGGTWSYYPKKYQIWFISECFRAMNEFGHNLISAEKIPINKEDIVIIDISSDLKNDINEELRNKIGNKPYNQLIVSKEYKEIFKGKVVEEKYISWQDLENQQLINSKGKCRCVGLVLETRPDSINIKEVLNLRRLGATKIQLGIQILNDDISLLNKRGETKNDTIKAFELLRAGGFKIHGHMMPNLFGATPKIDLESYKELFESENYKPDELKIYPTSIIKNTELYDRWQEGKYFPYNKEDLSNLIADCMEFTPEYCRLTRIIRDIPSTEIESGNTTTNLREIVEFKLKNEKRLNSNIRAREIKNEKVKFSDLTLDIIKYKTKNTTEYFLQYITITRKIVGFLRLSIPDNKLNPITDELNNAAIIREVHVYGPSLELKKDSQGEGQHLGLGSKLIKEAENITKNNNFSKLAVISSIGTREYYQKRGFKLEKLYQILKDL